MQAFMSYESSFLNQFVYINVFYDLYGVLKNLAWLKSMHIDE